MFNLTNLCGFMAYTVPVSGVTCATLPAFSETSWVHANSESWRVGEIGGEDGYSVGDHDDRIETVDSVIMPTGAFTITVRALHTMVLS